MVSRSNSHAFIVNYLRFIEEQSVRVLISTSCGAKTNFKIFYMTICKANVKNKVAQAIVYLLETGHCTEEPVIS